MTLANLIIEHAPAPQQRMSHAFEGGTLVIGRGDMADWQLDDPDQYLSRKHSIVAESDGQVTLTDASRAGTFVDGSEKPLGTGNSVTLTDGMRLRMGDFVFRIDMVTASQTEAEPPAQLGEATFTFAPADPVPTAEAAKRPDNLPDPFDPFAQTTAKAKAEPPKPPKPFGMDDPFGLDLPATDPEPQSSGGYFDTPARAPSPKPDPISKTPETVPPSKPAPVPEVAPPMPAPPPPASESALRDALLRGMGLDPDQQQTDDPVAQMEAIGLQYRYFAEGVMHLLRARASAKQQVRVAQTLISSADVNPLKFMATTDDAIETLMGAEKAGYLTGRDAITGAYRDLADHQMRTWKALQSALRRMIDQFDPKTIETEIADSGMLQSLLAGGKSAQLWQAYEERYRDIASAAEEKFLGEVGENFRDAYEGSEEN